MRPTYLRYPCLLFCLLCYVPTLLAQVQPAPGSITEYSVWFAEQDMENTLGNYRSIDLLKLQAAINADALDFDEESTVFLVLELNQKPEGKAFLKLGDLVICDDHISVSGRRMPIRYTVGEPSIVSIQHRKNKTYGQISTGDLKLGDQTLFSLAELVVYPKALSREERRKVSSYLALKYSIPITQNKDEKWRDYWSHNAHFYWNKSVDFLFDKEVVALGKSNSQQFFQPQTATNSKDTLILSIGDTLGLGNMPEIEVSDESYVIFAKKNERIRNGIACSKTNIEEHPLLNWKFYLQDWKKQAQPLFLKVAAVDDSLPTDSLFIHDGVERYFLPLVSNNNGFWTYRANLEDLEDDVHYLFMSNTQLDCNKHFEDPDAAHVLNEGDFQSISGKPIDYPLNEQQYISVWSDVHGEPFAIDLKQRDPAKSDITIVEQPKIKVYPNPSGQSTLVTIEIQELKGAQAVDLSVFNANGKLIHNKELKHEKHIITSFTPRTPGFYTICIRQGEEFFVFKHVVSQ
jgi:hypothetical protein